MKRLSIAVYLTMTLIVVLLFLIFLVAAWPTISKQFGDSRAVFVTVASGFVLALLCALLWLIPRNQIESQIRAAANTPPQANAAPNPSPTLGLGGRLYAENAARLTLAQILGGFLLLLGLLFTWQQIITTNKQLQLQQQQLQVQQQGQINDRFSRAIDQIRAVDSKGQPDYEVRLAGIYTLGQIASAEQQQYYTPIIDILTEYLRRNDRWPGTADAPPLSSPHDFMTQPIMDVLRDLLRLHRAGPELNLSRTDLRAVNLSNMDLSGVNLEGAGLQGAMIDRRTCLDGADLQEAIGLSQTQLDSATTDGQTQVSATPGVLENHPDRDQTGCR